MGSKLSCQEGGLSEPNHDAGAFRRSELAALQAEDLAQTPDGLRVAIRRSKTDQEGQGQEVAIPRGYRLRPVEAVQTWLAAAEINSGPC